VANIIIIMHKALLLLGCTAGVLGYETEGNVLKLG
jgi:hypothetical protein